MKCVLSMDDRDPLLAITPDGKLSDGSSPAWYNSSLLSHSNIYIASDSETG